MRLQIGSSKCIPRPRASSRFVSSPSALNLFPTCLGLNSTISSRALKMEFTAEAISHTNGLLAFLMTEAEHAFDHNFI